jgi:hypothetical protein
MVVLGTGLLKMAESTPTSSRTVITRPKPQPGTIPTILKEVEDVNDDDAFTTKGFDDESATIVSFDEEL